MRILIAAEIYHPYTTGSAYATYRLAHGLASRGYQIFVVSSGHGPRTEKTKEDRVEVFRISSVPIPFHPHYYFSPFAYFFLPPIWEEIKPDIIHVQDHFFICWALIEYARKNSIPVIGTNHFHPDNLVHYLHLPPKIENKLRALAWKHFNGVFGQVDMITTPSKTACKIMMENGLKREIQVISNGIDLNKFKPRPAHEVQEVIKKYRMEGEEKKILFVGRLEKEKNINVLIKALKLINKKMAAKLFLCGFGSEENRLKELARRSGLEGKVLFLGRVPDEDLRKIYNGVNLFATASTVELQSLVVMEAMASGLPVVSSESMALPELVVDGVNGFAFPPGDSQIAADRIMKILSNPELAKQMGQRSLEFIQNHDFEKTLDAYERLYSQQAGDKKKNKLSPGGSLIQRSILNFLLLGGYFFSRIMDLPQSPFYLKINASRYRTRLTQLSRRGKKLSFVRYRKR